MRSSPAHLLKRLIQGFRRFPRQAWVLVKETFSEWNNDNASLLGAALAFYTIFSLAPILIIIVAMVGFFLGKEWVDSYILGELTKLVGESNAAYVMATIQSSYLSGSGFRATLVAISLMLIGATTVGVVSQECLEYDMASAKCHLWDLAAAERPHRSFPDDIICGDFSLFIHGDHCHYFHHELIYPRLCSHQY